jgi:aerobic-type carbon monoxide dehydrogenase small subunit (CoxS/CutS family)
VMIMHERTGERSAWRSVEAVFIGRRVFSCGSCAFALICVSEELLFASPKAIENGGVLNTRREKDRERERESGLN